MSRDPRFTLVGGQVLINTHSDRSCDGEYCALHHFSDHHMIEWKQTFLPSFGVWRICPHGCEHPDPDDRRAMFAGHPACDGCCTDPTAGMTHEEIVESLREMAAELLS